MNPDCRIIGFRRQERGCPKVLGAGYDYGNPANRFMCDFLAQGVFGQGVPSASTMNVLPLPHEPQCSTSRTL